MSKEKEIIMLALESKGFIKRDICREIAGSEPYCKKILHKLTSNGMAETIHGQGKGIIMMKSKAYKSMGLEVPDSRRREKAARCSKIGQVIYNAKLVGWEYEECSSPGSRAHGILTSPEGEVYIAYDFGTDNLKFKNQFERRNKNKIRAQKKMHREPNAIVYVNDYSMCKKLLENENPVRTGKEQDRLTAHSYFERILVVEENKKGAKTILEYDETAKERIKTKYGAKYGLGIGDGICEAGEIYDLQVINLFKLSQLIKKEGRKVILCSEGTRNIVKELANSDDIIEIVSPAEKNH